MYSITVPEVYLCLYNEENGIWIHKMKKGASNKMKGYREAYKKAFPYTIPVLTGYIFIGVAFGVMFAEKGYSFLWAALMSILVYAGSGQYLAVNFFVPIQKFQCLYDPPKGLHAGTIFAELDKPFLGTGGVLR